MPAESLPKVFSITKLPVWIQSVSFIYLSSVVCLCHQVVPIDSSFINLYLLNYLSECYFGTGLLDPIC